MRALDEDETSQLLAGVEVTSVHVPVFLAVFTGMRRGEILALRWADVDLGNATLSVRRSLEETHRNGLRFKEPKSRSGIRQVDLPPLLVDALRRHRSEQAKLRLSLGSAWKDHDLVCCSPDGGPMSPDNLSSSFPKLVRRLGIPRIRFHDLRHTHASLLLRQGVHPKVVSERLGHSGVGLTLDTYSHLLPGLQREAAERLNSLLNEATNRHNREGDGQGMAKRVVDGESS
jgi:integrase